MTRPLSFIVAILVMFASSSLPAGLVYINEFQPNPTGNPDNMLELLGCAGESFSGWFLDIEGDTDASSTIGVVQGGMQISGTFDSNGLLTVNVGNLEDPSGTYLLVDNFTGTISNTTGTDIDSNNDGTADNISTLGNVIDSIGVTDGNPDFGSLYGDDFWWDQHRLHW